MLPDGYQIGRRIPLAAWVFSVRRLRLRTEKTQAAIMDWAARVAVRHDSTKASSVGINRFFRT